jgi:hypothetical protein
MFWIRRFGRWLLEAWDLAALLVTATVLTLLGILGSPKPEQLGSATLGVLTLMAATQLRTRRDLVRASREPTEIMLSDFPPTLARDRADATSYLYVGVSMVRTIHSSTKDIRDIIGSGGRVRLMVLDPDVPGLVEGASQPSDEETSWQLRRRIQSALREIQFLNDSIGGGIEVRTTNSVPRVSINSIDPHSRRGRIVVQHYEYRAQKEASPILSLSASMGAWYDHFRDEAERMWEDGQQWPAPPLESIRKRATTSSNYSLEADLDLALAAASDVTLVGVTRHQFLTDRFPRLQERIDEGMTLRVLLPKPGSVCADTARESYRADREVDIDSVIQQSVRLVANLASMQPERVSLFFTDAPLVQSSIAIDVDFDRFSSGIIFAKLHTYRTTMKPSLILTPGSGELFSMACMDIRSRIDQSQRVDLE